MKLSIKIDAGKKLRIHTVTGKLNLDLLVKKLQEIYNRSDFQPDINSIWDLRGADVSSFSFEDIIQLREFVSGHWGISGDSKSALVVAQEVDFGLGRMYASLLESKTPNKINIFRDIEEAYKWISAH